MQGIKGAAVTTLCTTCENAYANKCEFINTCNTDRDYPFMDFFVSGTKHNPMAMVFRCEKYKQETFICKYCGTEFIFTNQRNRNYCCEEHEREAYNEKRKLAKKLPIQYRRLGQGDRGVSSSNQREKQ